MIDSPTPSRETQENEIHVFLCYRRIDGYAAAEKIHELIHGQHMDQDKKIPITVFFDREMPAFANWEDHHAPALKRSRAMIIVITPGLGADVSTDTEPDWVRKEIQWWMQNYPDVAPILVDCTNQGERFLPKFAKGWWTKVNRVRLECQRLDDLDEEKFRQRIIQGIKDREGLVRYKQVEKLENALKNAETARKKEKKTNTILKIVVSLLALAFIFLGFLLIKTNDQRLVAVAGEQITKDPTRAALTLLKVFWKSDEAVSSRLRELLKYATTELEVRHSDGLNAVGFSPDGGRIVTASRDGKAIVREIAEGGRSVALDHGEKEVSAAVFSVDSQHVVTASTDKTVKIWNVAKSEAQLPQVLPHQSAVLTVAFNPNRMQFVTGSQNGSVMVWNLQNGSWVGKTLGQHGNRVVGVAYNRAGSWVATSSWDNTVRIWDVTDATGGRALTPPLEHGGKTVHAANFSSDGHRLVTACEDGKARVWQLDRQGEHLEVELVAKLPHDGAVLAAAFSPDGKYVATASKDRTAKLWIVRDSAIEMLTRLPHSHPVRAVEFSPDSRRVVTAAEDGSATIWKTRSGAMEAELRGHTDSVIVAVFSPDGRRIATASLDGSARVWKPEGLSREVPVPKEIGRVKDITFFETPRILALSQGKPARVWRLNDLQHPIDLADSQQNRSEGLEAAVLSPNGRQVVTIAFRSTLLWRIDEENAKADFVPILHDDEVLLARADFSPDSRRLATTGRQHHVVQVWRAEEPGHGSPSALLKKPIAKLIHGNEIIRAIFSPNGRWLVSGEKTPGKIRVWDVHAPAERSQVCTYEPNGDLLSAAFPSDNRLWTASGNGKILHVILRHFQDCDEKSEIVSWSRPFEASVRAAAFSTEGRYLIVATADGSARIYDLKKVSRTVETQELREVAQLQHFGQIVKIGFSPNADIVFVAEEDSVRIWPLSPAQLVQAIRHRVRPSLGN